MDSATIELLGFHDELICHQFHQLCAIDDSTALLW